MVEVGRGLDAKLAPDRDDYSLMVARAKALVPTLRERAARTEELRRLPPETERDLHDSGLFRILQHKRVGGKRTRLCCARRLRRCPRAGRRLVLLEFCLSCEPPLDAGYVCAGGTEHGVGRGPGYANRLLLCLPGRSSQEDACRIRAEWSSARLVGGRSMWLEHAGERGCLG